jgi:uncharacterized membrane protein YfhO
MDLAFDTRTSRVNGLLLLISLQALVSLVLFHDYLSGDKFFAFVDIASDTYHQFVPILMHMASPANWDSAWSFNVGLGASAPLSFDPFTLLGIAGGPAHVLDLRIWVYLAKIATGGAAFYGFALALGARRESALIVALAYSFCGYVMTDGEWDPSATDFAAYAIILCAFARQAKRGSFWLVPASIAFAIYAGVFVFSIGIFVIYMFLAATVASDRPAVTAQRWLRSVFPKCLLGLALAAPVVVSLAYRYLDSPRITGAQAAFGNRLREILTLNDNSTVLIQLAGFFHKNLLGIGIHHYGWMNYLESPVFYVGVLALLIIPQLWRGTRIDRRILVAGGIFLILFIALPAIRYVAFGFGLDYFRVNNLWVSILLLVLFARALEVIAVRGIGGWLLAGTFSVLALVLFDVHLDLLPSLSLAHESKIEALACVGLILAALFAGQAIQWKQFAALALVFVAADCIVVNYATFHERRQPVTSMTTGYKDETVPALAFLRARDHGFYRVEKTYNSVSFCDALVQDYMGVKSYWFQDAGVTGFFSDLGLLPRRSRIKNYTNWLPNFGGRFVLYSLVGVKYIIANQALEWPGFRKIHETGSLAILENDLALPLGVLYERQYPRGEFMKMKPEAKDITMVNAVIVDQPRGTSPRIFDAAGQYSRQSPDWLEDNYMAPARLLKSRGMVIEKFSHGHIVGTVDSAVPGVLAFSIPFAKGWSVAVDGIARPLFSANLGMLATDLTKGRHRIELRYALPGLVPGMFIGLLGLLALLVANSVARYLPPAAPLPETA